MAAPTVELEPSSMAFAFVTMSVPAVTFVPPL